MFCSNCGLKLAHGDKFCSSCGTQRKSIKPAEPAARGKASLNDDGLTLAPASDATKRPRRSLLYALLAAVLVVAGAVTYAGYALNSGSGSSAHHPTLPTPAETQLVANWTAPIGFTKFDDSVAYRQGSRSISEIGCFIARLNGGCPTYRFDFFTVDGCKNGLNVTVNFLDNGVLTYSNSQFLPSVRPRQLVSMVFPLSTDRAWISQKWSAEIASIHCSSAGNISDSN